MFERKDKVKILFIADTKKDLVSIEKGINGVAESITFQSPDNLSLTDPSNFSTDVIIMDFTAADSILKNILEFSGKSKNPIPVLLYASKEKEDEAVIMLKKGFWDYLIKESPERFEQIVFRAIEWKRMKKELSLCKKDINEFEKYIKQFRRWEANVPAVVYQFVIHPDGTQAFKYISSASKKLFNLEPNDIVRDINLLMKNVYPDDLPELQRAIQESAVNIQPLKHQVRYNNNGVTQWYDLNSIPHKENNGEIVWDGIMMDITEKKLAEEKFFKEHNFMQTLMDNSPDAIYFKDLESRFLKVSNGFLTKFNIASEDKLLGKTDFDLFDFDHANAARNDELEIIRTSMPIIDKQEKEIWSSGKVTWVSSTKIAFKDENGNVIGTIGISRDITEGKISQDKLKSSEAHFRNLISSTPAILFTLSVNDNIVKPSWIGDNIIGILGYTPEEALQNSWWDHALHSDDKDYVNSEFNNLFKSGKLGFEYRFMHKNGNYLWMRAELILLKDAFGNPKEIYGSWLDITERMITQESLLNSEKQLLYALKISRAAYWSYDVEKDEFAFNDQFYSLLKTNAETEGGYMMSSARYASRFVHPGDLPMVGEEIKKAIEATDPNFNSQLEHRFIRLNGEQGYFSVRFFIKKDSSGKTIKTFGVNQDITERKLADEALRMSEERYRLLINNAEFPVVVSSLKDGKVLFANEHAISYFNLDSKNAIGEIAPNYWCSLDDRKRFIAELLQNQRVRGFEAALKNVQDEKKWALISANIITFENEKASFTVFSDITSRKHVEEALKTSEYFLRKSQSVARVGSFKYDIKAGKWESSKTLDEILGIEENYLKSIKGWLKTIHPAHRTEVISILKTQVFLQRKRFEKEYKIVRQDNGQERWILGVGDLEFDSKGNPVAIIGTAQDITERIIREQEKQALEEQLKQRNKDLEKMISDLKKMQGTLVQSEKMVSLGQLSAGIAHEINNPLSFVSSNINRLEEYFNDTLEILKKWKMLEPVLSNLPQFNEVLKDIKYLSEKVDLEFIITDFDRMMHSVQDGTNRIKKIIEGMRGFTHLSDNSFSAVNINQAIEETLTIVWNEIKYKASIEKELGNLPPVECNAIELKQVLVNLLVNAAHAINEKGLIKISTSFEDEYVSVKIKDNGCGIPHDNIKRIFDPFFTTKPVGSGTGLGLWVSSSIIEKHNGSLTVNSVPGEGSTFTFKLPVKQKTNNKNGRNV